jgi:hypothetical protein
MFLLALLLQHYFDKTLWLKCHIQWLYLAVHGCKTYLNLNLNHPVNPFVVGGKPFGSVVVSRSTLSGELEAGGPTMLAETAARQTYASEVYINSRGDGWHK